MDFNQIKNIIFDLGNVIINIDFDLTYKAFAKLCNKDLQEVYKKFETQQIWERYELGDLSNEAFVQLLKNELQSDASEKEIITAWNALLLDIPLKRVEKIKELSKKYRIFILSNTSNLHILDVNRILKEQTGVENLKELVETTYYSYEMGLRKPDPKIYTQVLEQNKLLAQETLFLDDNLANIVAAKALEIHCIHITDQDMCQYLKDA